MGRSELLAKIQVQRMWLEDIRGKSLAPQLEAWKAKYLTANNLTHLDTQGLEQLLKALESMPKTSVGDVEGLDLRIRDRIKAGDYAIAFTEEVIEEEYF
jgi:hypothetical protein